MSSQSLSFEQKLSNLGAIIAQSAGVQAGGTVLLYCFAGTEQLARYVREWCYETHNAGYVLQMVVDPAQQLQHAPADMKYHFPQSERDAWDQAADDQTSAVIQLRTEVDGQQFADGVSYARWYDTMWETHDSFFEQGVARGLVPWTLFYAPNLYHAECMFPIDRTVPGRGVNQEAVTIQKAWDAIFAATYADQADALSCWEANLKGLEERNQILNSQNIKELHFTGPGTDLRVGLSQKALWLGGAKTLYDGCVRCVNNVPTFENYSTPDWRQTNGFVRATCPLIIKGTLVAGLELTFENGVVTEVSAENGEAHMKQIIASDDGAARLGEVALVGADSPIARQNQLFYSTLYDENAACHIALGNAYRTCLEAGPTMCEEELDELGCNNSKQHQDLMISDEHTTVRATSWSGKELCLMEHGRWLSPFC